MATQKYNINVTLQGVLVEDASVDTLTKSLESTINPTTYTLAELSQLIPLDKIKFQFSGIVQQSTIRQGNKEFNGTMALVGLPEVAS